MARQNVRQFLIGLVVGMSVFYIGFYNRYLVTSTGVRSVTRNVHFTSNNSTRTAPENHPQHVAEGYLTVEDIKKIQEIVKPIKFEDKHEHHDDDAEAKSLEKKVRVLCWIMTSPDNLDKKAIHVRNTWAKRCNTLLFISSVTNDSFPTIGVDAPEGRQHLTAKTMKAFRLIYERYFDKADWFMKADDDTYVIVENLRYFLSGQNTNDPVYFGHHFNVIVKDSGYFSGGAGYVLSKEALKRFGEKGPNVSFCKEDGGAEDVKMGNCMKALGVRVGNSTDSLGRSRFHCFNTETHLFGGYPNWYYKYDALGAKAGKESISDYAISFHYVQPAKMYAFEFYIYHLRPYGIQSGPQELNKKTKK